MRIILVILLIVEIILLPLFSVLIFERPLFAFLYNLLNLQQTSGLPKDVYLDKVSKIVKYFFTKDKFLEIEGITEIEKIHMKDVKTLILISFIILTISSLTLFFLRRFIDKRTLKISGISILVIIAFLLFEVFFNFDSAFYYFHKVLFRNNYWLLDPNTVLIRLFPEKVFLTLSIIWFLLSLIISLVFML